MRSSRANWKAGLVLLVAGGMVSLLSGATANLPKVLWRTFEAVTVTADAAGQAAKSAGAAAAQPQKARGVTVKKKNADVTISTSMTFAAADASDGTVDGVFTVTGNLTMTNGGAITCNDPASPTTASACPITIVVSGNMEMQAGSQINANNTVDGGTGGEIKITVGGDFTMRGPAGGNSGALITSQHLGTGTDDGGRVTIVVGGVTLDHSVDPAIGVCNTPTGDVLIESGALITTDSNTHRAGDIGVYAGHNITISGTVRAEGTGGTGHGGAITVDACCFLLVSDSGLVRSAGRDPGPDRVHLQGCTVTILGVVESTGPAHQGPAPLCTPPIRPGKPANSSACVEIWAGTNLTIDSTSPHNGQVNADVGQSGGTQGRGWVDILANGSIIINGNTTTPYVNPGDNSLVTPPWAIHANMALQNGTGGVINVQSKATDVSATGRAIQANASTGSNGGAGGSATIQASGNVLLDGASVQTMGDNSGGGSQAGGSIAVRSFNGTVTGASPGELNADGGGGGGTVGTVTITGCGTPAPGDGVA